MAHTMSTSSLLDASAGAGSILICAVYVYGAFRLRATGDLLVPADWRWFMKFPHHYIWQFELSPVLSVFDNKPTF